MKDASKRVAPIIRKIVGILLILVLLTGIGVMATNVKVNNVKIILSNGYEMEVVTTKTKISDILDENHIVLLPEESVIPKLESELSDNNTIKIVKGEAVEIEAAEVVENSENASSQEILSSYDNIVEKIEVVEEEIPFETITKDVSESAEDKKDVVVQEGKNGLKEVTYKVKYQNDVEIERTIISENIVREPVNKVIEVRKRITVTSRYSGAIRTSYGQWSYSEEELDLICAITAQECSSSYEGSLAVITCACNRAEINWGRYGTDPLSQYKARYQFCYSIDSHWRRRLNGNYNDNVVRAVMDALSGKRNHNYLSFRAASSGHSGVNIGNNVYFNAM